MARPKKTAETDQNINVVGSTVEDRKEKSEDLQGADVVTLCVSLRNGHVFDDIPDGKGGFKKITLAGSILHALTSVYQRPLNSRLLRLKEIRTLSPT